MEHDWKGQVAIAVVLLGIGAAAVYWFGQNMLPSVEGIVSNERQSAVSAQTVFTCDGGKSIVVAFGSDQAHLTLSDGREMTIPHAASASGARYANADESFVFWNKGTTALIEERGEMTYSTCVTN